MKNYKSAYSDIKNEAEIAGKSIPFLANVEKLNFVESTDPMKLQFDTELAINTAVELGGDPLTREEFLEAEFWTQQRYYTSKSTQYLEHYADEQIKRDSELEYGEQLYNYNSTFVTNELREFMISKLGAGYKPLDMANKYVEGKSDIERSLTQAEAEGIASTLAMEANFLEQSRYAQGDVLVTELQPTEVTYDILNRWKEVHYLNPEIPYPENEIDLNDWKGIRSFKLEHQGEIEINFPGLFAYIDRGTVEGEVEDLVVRKSGGNQ
ncbi:transposase [Bacillus sp. JCM 19046]|nr:transposase [Bacillus sp. JCM 19046]